MDIRVQELLDKIKRDGVESAQADAAKILSDAEVKRAAIVAAADKEARAIVDGAKTDAQRSAEAGRAALVQASRDLLLAFKGQIDEMLS